MATTPLEAEFWNLCKKADDENLANLGMTRELEHALLNILNFVKGHPSERDTFVRCFVELGTQAKGLTYWILLFCMRELRYPEVQRAVNEHFTSLGGPEKAARLMNFVSDVNWVYDDAPWEDADFFEYHWHREHPGEPWPLAKHDA